MIKAILRRMPLVLLLMVLLGTYAFADFGPKPSVVVEFTGAENQEYYVTLVAREDQLGGPYHRITLEDQPEIENPAVWNRLVAYEDPDGLVFAGGLQKLTGDGAYVWSYYPPEEFRILVCFPSTGYVVTSKEILSQYAFDSYYQVDFADMPENWNSAVGTFPVTRKYNVLWQAVAFLLRLAVTVIIESLLAVCFGFVRKRQLWLIFIVNCVTQLSMNLLMLTQGSVHVFALYVLQYALAELGVVLAEGLVYYLVLPKLAAPNDTRKKHPIWYALVGNLASFVLGYWLSSWFPMLFS